MDVVIDIETYRDITDKHMQNWEKNVKPDGRLKDQDKIAADIEKKRQEYQDRAALSPVTGKIVCAGIGIMESGLVSTVSSREEKDVIDWLDDALNKNSPTTIITYNGRRFDLPYLIGRYAKHGFEPGFPWPIGYSQMHVDLYDVLGGGSLNDWAITMLGCDKDTGGDEIAAMYACGDMAAIEQHCRDDVSLTMDIWSRVKKCINPGGRGGKQVW